MKFQKYFDHTILNQDATKADVLEVVNEAIKYDFASVCVNSCYAGFVSGLLKDTTVKTCCVVGFPLGAMSTAAKVFETKQAVEDGADEIDMVINIGAVKGTEYDFVKQEIAAIKGACDTRDREVLLKVIIETCLLTNEEKAKACELACEAGADFVKTSTGFSKSGADTSDILIMRRAVDNKCDELGIPRIKVKASGGIRTLDTAYIMLGAGADRLGTSATVKICKSVKN